jgi:hypothetical protein
VGDPAGAQPADDLEDHAGSFKFLIRDRDARFTAAFDAVFTGLGVRIIKTPVRAPGANAIAGRWISSARRECLDRVLITSERHLRLVLSEYLNHYGTHRPHRALQQSPPAGRAHPPAEVAAMRVLRHDRLGGLIHEYTQVAYGDTVSGTHTHPVDKRVGADVDGQLPLGAEHQIRRQPHHRGFRRVADVHLRRGHPARGSI